MNTSTRRATVCTLVGLWLGACSGVPVRSLPRLMALRTELMSAEPAQFILAVQTDEAVRPAASAVPTLNIEIRPAQTGGFEALSRQLPLALSVTPAPPGLPRAGQGRHWMVYHLTPASQAELARIQARFGQLQAQRERLGGGTLSVGIAQEGLASEDPRLAHVAWESWLQTRTSEGFFELWSGTLGQLRAQARGPVRR